MFAVCGGRYNSAIGRITSPGYPSSYQASIHCMWAITSLPGKHIKLEISTVTFSTTGDLLEVKYHHFILYSLVFSEFTIHSIFQFPKKGVTESGGYYFFSNMYLKRGPLFPEGYYISERGYYFRKYGMLDVTCQYTKHTVKL